MTLMERRRALMGVGGSAPILPTEYQQVEWIGNDTNGPKISLSLSVTIPYNITFIATPDSFAPNTTGPYACAGRIAYSNLNNDWYIVFRSTSLVVKNGDNFTIDSYSISEEIFTVEGTVNVPNAPGNITLFRPSPNGTAKTRIYRFTATKDGTTICDLIPCYRIADGVIGMFDIVSNAFKQNSGSGTFTKGADV